MVLNVIVPQFFLPVDSVKLGRFVTSVDEPHQGYHDPPTTAPPQQIVSRRDTYVGAHEIESDSGFKAALTSLMSAGFSKRAKMRVKITTEQATTYTLDNSDGWFDDATTIPATRIWLERSIDRGDDIYMVVAFHVLTNARVAGEQSRGHDVDGKANVPVSLALTSAGVIAPLGDLIDPSIETRSHSSDSSQSSFVALGERICAFQYRKIEHKWLSSKKLDTSQLSKTPRWSSVEKSRDEDEEEEDTIQVETAEVEETALEGEWDREEAPGGDVWVLRSGKDEEDEDL